MSDNSESEFQRQWIAPRLQAWVCGACGRHHKQRDKVGDESCFMNARLAFIDSLVYDQDDRVTQCKWVSDAAMDQKQ